MLIYNINQQLGIPERLYRKILLIMRLTTVILIASLMQVSATGLAQKITIRQSNAPLETILNELRKQTGFDFIYTDKQIKSSRPVSINLKAAQLEEALQHIFKDQPLAFSVQSGTVIIKEKEPSFLDKTKSVILNLVQDLIVRGKIIGENDQVLAGATVKVKGTNRVTKSNEKGEFYLAGVEDDAVLEISYIGFKALEIPVKGAVMPLEIKLNVATGELEEVKVVYNTGYQNIDKTRATGSFVQVDNELINRKVGTDILSRLEGVVPGLLFDRRPDQNGNPKQNLQIRGLYTLTEAISQPLIVVDNFPFAGNLLDINPNDVENITVLKDAAAASIWGAKAGNGVIVITTKKGNFNQKFKVSLNTNLTTSNKPDLFSIRDMSVDDYIDVEKFLFDKGQYNALIDDPIGGTLTPVQEILLRKRNGLIDANQANAEIDVLKKYDVRNDLAKYIYRNEVNQQYALNLSGGSNTIKYAISGGYDKNLSNLNGNQFDRVSFRSNTTLAPVKQLQIMVGIAYGQTNTISNSPGGYNDYKSASTGGKIYSYARFADENGNPLPLDLQYRSTYTDTAGNGRLLDWKYRPLQELENNSNVDQMRNLIGDLNISYDLFKGLSARLSYQYQRSQGENTKLLNTQLFNVRDLINQFTQLNGGATAYIVPNESMLLQTNTSTNTQSLRTGLNFNHNWNNKHEVSAIAGAEIRDGRKNSSTDMTYGYSDRLSFANMDFVNLYPVYTSYGGAARVPNSKDFTGFKDRFVSLYGNASYTYNEKYTLTGSIRRDASNLFGVKTNDKGRPFWSVGVLWDITKESFYKIDLIPELKARITYGYSGNVNNRTGTAITTIRYGIPSIINNLPVATIANPGTPSLRWEKLRTFNSSIDFGFKNQVIYGRIEYYKKKSTDVIAFEMLDNTTGVANVPTNSAHMMGDGIDISLNSQIINSGQVRYHAGLNFSYVKYVVTKYLGNLDALGSTSNGQLITPVSNPYSIVSFRWAGLDPETGDPRGFLNGKVSKQYDSLTRFTRLKDNLNHGSALPKFYGNILNSFSFGKFSMSANITYKLGYYFTKPTINYESLFNRGDGHADYNKRWQKPGDELTTYVPSLVYGSPSDRQAFYARSEVLVEKADHIRLEDIRFDYTFSKEILQKLRLGTLKVYWVLDNLNILLYKANKANLDPNFTNGLKTSKRISVGLSADF